MRPISEEWSTPEWSRKAIDWIDGQLARHGLVRTAGVDLVRVRPWSVQVRVPVGGTTVWFKACADRSRHEVGITGLLHRALPGSVPAPLGADPARGWLLSQDGGRTLRESGVDVRHRNRVWERVLAEHAVLQRRAAEWYDDLVAVGVPVWTPGMLVGEWARRVPAEVAGGPAGQRLRSAAERLTATGPLTAPQHDDFHDGNVFVEFTDGLAGRVMVFDWGDSYLGHPFSCLLVALTGVDGRDRSRMVDAYLEPWRDLVGADGAALVEDAVLIGCVGRALGWERALCRASVSELDRWGSAGVSWLDRATARAVGG